MPKPSRKATAAERQIKLALFVQAHGPVTRAQIQNRLPEYAVAASADQRAAKRAEASARRRFERDKAELASMGIIVSSPDREHYTIESIEEPAFSGLEAGSPQASLLRVAGTALLQDPAYAQGANLRMALSKLSGALEIPDALNWATGDSLGALRKTEPVNDGSRRKIQSALSAHKLLNFDYVDAAGKPSQRQVEPIALFAYKGREYLAAWDPSRNAQRSFRLDRMSKLSVNDNGRGKPDFQPREFHLNDWQLLPFQMGGESICTAQVRIDQSALWQALNLCAGHGSLVKNPDGSMTWEVSCTNARQLAAWCIANGPGVIPQLPEAASMEYARLVEEAAGWSQATTASVSSSSEPKPAIGYGDFGAGEALVSQELLEFEETLRRLCRNNPLQEAQTGAGLSDNDVLVAVLCLIEQAGALSIPQTAQLLSVEESAVYHALETLAFCYDAAAETRLDLGEEGCAFAVLPHPANLSVSLTPSEIQAISSAALSFTAGPIIGTLTAMCGEEEHLLARISYWKEGEEGPSERIVEPQTLITREDHLYLQAWCHNSNGQRLFRVDRIISLETLGKQIEDLSAVEVTTQTEHPTRGSITLAAQAQIPNWPGLTRAKKQAADGSVSFTVPWHGSSWLPKHIASLGSSVTSIEPQELAEAAGSYARSLLG